MKINSSSLLFLSLAICSCKNGSFTKKKFLDLKPLKEHYSDPKNAEVPNLNEVVEFSAETKLEQPPVVKTGLIGEKRDTDVSEVLLAGDLESEDNHRHSRIICANVEMDEMTKIITDDEPIEDERSYDEQQLMKYRLISMICLISAAGLAAMTIILFFALNGLMSFQVALMLFYAASSAVGLVIVGMVYAFKQGKFAYETKDKAIKIINIIASFVVLYAAIYAFSIAVGNLFQ
jgi:hypothetical protein